MHRSIRSLPLIALLAAGPLAAQSKIGLVAGGVMSSLKFENSNDANKSRMGFAAGLSMSGGSGKIAFSPEALYVMKGNKFDDGSNKGGTKLSYVEVPLLFRANLGTSTAKPFVTAGPTVAYNLSCKSYEDGGTSEDCEEEGDDTSGIKKLDYGLMVGAGAHFGHMAVSLRYEMGFANLNKSDNGGTVKNNAIFLMLQFGGN